MKRTMILAAMGLWTATVASCAGGTARQAAPENRAEGVETEAVQQVVTGEEEPFPFPDIPEVMTDPDERRSYLLQHYWDRYDFADTTLLQRDGVTEQGLVNYVALVGTHPDRAEADGAVDGFCRKMAAGEQSRQVFASLLEKYLYDPMSPLRDDALYVMPRRRMRGATAGVSSGSWRGATIPARRPRTSPITCPTGGSRRCMGRRADNCCCSFMTRSARTATPRCWR